MTSPAWWRSSYPTPASIFPDNPWESMAMSKPSERLTAAIIGSGFIGRAWAISFARSGADIRLWDQADGASEKAVDYISGVLDDLARNDLLNGAEPATVLARIKPVATLEAAVAEANHVQENTPEV